MFKISVQAEFSISQMQKNILPQRLTTCLLNTFNLSLLNFPHATLQCKFVGVLFLHLDVHVPSIQIFTNVQLMQVSIKAEH